MTEHFFPLKHQSIQTQQRVLAPKSNLGVEMGPFQWGDVTVAPRAYTSDDAFSIL